MTAIENEPIRSDTFESQSFFKATKNASRVDVREFSKVEMRRAVFPIFMDWAIIAASIGIAVYLSNFVTDFLAMLVVATRQHGFLVIVHEGAHFRISINKTVNDWITDLFAGFPIFFCTQGYRKNHHGHHRFLNSDKDPDWTRKIHLSEWQFPQTNLQLAKTALKIVATSWYKLVILFYNLSGIGQKSTYKSWNSVTRLASKVIFYTSIGVLCFKLGALSELLKFWVIPFLLILPLIERVRSISEHFALPYDTDFSQTRNVLCGRVEAFLFGPHNIRYHLVHHLYPTVPQYNLPEFHARLMQDESYRLLSYNNDSYVLGGRHSVLQDIRSTFKSVIVDRTRQREAA